MCHIWERLVANWLRNYFSHMGRAAHTRLSKNVKLFFASPTCIASWVIVFRNFPCLLLLASWYSQVFNLCDDFPFPLICSPVPKQYLTKEVESGWTKMLLFFMASLLTWLLLNVKGATSGQSMSASGSFVMEGVWKQPFNLPNASSDQTRYSGCAKLCLMYVQESSVIGIFIILWKV